MDALVDLCLGFFKDHASAIIASPIDLNCINTKLVMIFVSSSDSRLPYFWIVRCHDLRLDLSPVNSILSKTSEIRCVDVAVSVSVPALARSPCILSLFCSFNSHVPPL